MRARDSVTAVGGVMALAVSIFAVGGVLRWSQAAVALIVAIALSPLLLSRRVFARRSPLVVLLCIGAGLTFLQCIPLPHALLDALSPTAASLRQDGASLLDVDASTTLTSDHSGAIAALTFFVTLLGIAIIALRQSVAERGRYRVITVVAALCGLTALTVWIHRLLDLTSLYGVFEPDNAAPIMLGPILNGNTLACLMAVGAVLAMGLAASRRQPGWLRALWLVVVAACGAITVLTVSRGATLALLGGTLITISVLVGQRLLGQEGARRRSRFVTSALPIGVLAGCMIVLVIWSNAGHVERQLARLSFDEFHQSRSKFAAWQSAVELIQDSPWLGVGRGAFQAAFTRVHPASGLATYSHLENEYLQAVVDWGIPGALLFAFAATWLVVAAVRRWRDGPIAAGALGALAVIAIQSNVDFGLEFLGLAAPATAIAATLTHVPLRESSNGGALRLLRGGHVLALFAAAILVLLPAATTLDEDQRQLRSHPTLSNAKASVERHPLDYYGYAVAANIFARNNDPRAIPLLNHAMVLHPTHPGLHQMAARMLIQLGYVDQAAIEYAVALKMTSNPTRMLAEIMAAFPHEKAAEALPVDFSDPSELVRALAEANNFDVASRWLERVLRQRPRDSRACELLVGLAQRGSMAAAHTAGERCVALLPDYQAKLSLAQILVKVGDKQAVLALLADVEGWQSRVEDKISAWLVLCDAHRDLGSIDAAKRCLRRLDASPEMRPERRSEIMSRLEALRMPSPPTSPVDSPPATGSAATP